jgi:hypothetical protein
MPKMGIPSFQMDLSGNGALSLVMLKGDPDKMMALGAKEIIWSEDIL